MAKLENGIIYNYGEKIGEYSGIRGDYSANLGAWCFGGVSFSFFETKRELLKAIRETIKNENNWRRFSAVSW